MRALIQRVSSASVSTREGNANSIDQGFCILLGVGPDDTEEIAEKLWSKISKLRIFEDQNGKNQPIATRCERFCAFGFSIHALC